MITYILHVLISKKMYFQPFVPIFRKLEVLLVHYKHFYLELLSFVEIK